MSKNMNIYKSKKSNYLVEHTEFMKKRMKEIKDWRGIILMFIVFLSTLAFLGFTSAAPPVTTVSQFSEGLVIEYPALDYLKAGTTYDFHFHVFNISNGKYMTSGVDCFFHLYNSSGNHIFRSNDSIVSNDFDYSFKPDGQLNFSIPGTYYFIVQCNTSSLGGYAQRAFEVTATGEGKGNLIFIILLTAIGVIFFISSLFAPEEFFVYISGLSFLIGGIYLMINGFGIFNDTYTRMISYIYLGIGLLFTVGAYIFNWINEKKEEEEEY